MLFFLPFSGMAQYQFLQLNTFNELRYAQRVYTIDGALHSSVRPYSLSKLRGSSELPNMFPASKSFTLKKWIPRKAFKEHFLDYRGDNFWITADPVVNFQAGMDLEDDKVYLNSRGFMVQGKLGNKVSFYSAFTENQAIFPEYINSFVDTFTVVPGQGLSRSFKSNGHDFSLAQGEVSFKADEIFTITLGQGRNFFGDGYRSMFLSDVAYPYPFARIQTQFGRVKYTNLWAQMFDFQDKNTPSDNNRKKYLSAHHLSINLTNRWNVNLFEAIILADTNQQNAIDPSFFNPVIFYRPVEFAVGSRSGNAHIGIGSSYKLSKEVMAYGQFLLDELTVDEFFSGSGYWANKYSWQLGLKMLKSFSDKNMLWLRLEANVARPYIYSHNEPLRNYSHYGQPLAHPWGSNFYEGLAQVIYLRDKWELEARFHYGIRGLDSASSNWGTNIFESYHGREQNYDNSIGQGVEATYFYAQLRLAYLINPASGLKAEIGFRTRMLEADTKVNLYSAQNSSTILFGLRTELFTNYYDF